MPLYVHGIGHFHPENVIDNSFLESLDIGTDPNWIIERVGIHTRRTVLSLDYIRTTRNRDPRSNREASLYSDVETGRRAAQMALTRAGLEPRDVGMVISGGSYPTIGSPGVACPIAAALGIEAPSFDLNSACSTFFTQLRVVSMWQKELTADFVLLVQPENLTRMVDYRDRNTAVLMGDCSTAAVVSLRVPSAVAVDRIVQRTSPAGWERVVAYTGGHLRQDGPAVQAFGIRRMAELLQEFAGQSSADAMFVGHQANLLMLEAVCRRGGIPAERHLYNVDEFGNCGAAGCPSVLSLHWSSLFERRATVHAVVVGAGLTWAGGILEFEQQRSK
jgi:3-oxoacyl-[acyl-carrier-protein] synthase III